MLSLIVAMGQNGVIGTDTGLPWRLPADLARFRTLTLHKSVIMGRKTFDTIGKALPQRDLIVLTTTEFIPLAGVEVATTPTVALELAQANENEIVVAGGAQIYKLFAAQISKLYLTIVRGNFSGTIYFPMEIFFNNNWEIRNHGHCPADAANACAHDFYVMEKSMSLNRTWERILGSN